MHCVIIHQHFSTPAGSTSVRTWHFTKALVENGYEVTVVCGRSDIADTGCTAEIIQGNRSAFIEGVKIIECDVPYSNAFGMRKRMAAFFSFAVRAIGELMKMRADVVYVSSAPLTVAIPGLFAKYIMRIALVFEARDLWPKAPIELGILTNPIFVKAAKLLEKVVVRSSDALIALAPGSVAHFKQLGAKSDICFLPNFSKSVKDGIKNVNPDRAKLRAVYVGAHGIINELDASIDAAEIIENSDKKISLDFYGSGSEQIRFREKVRKKKLLCISFNDSIPKSDVHNVLRAHDVGLLLMKDIEAMRSASSPNKFFDYLAAGLPIICNYEGWLADEIRSNECGLVIGRKPEQLAEALIWLYNNPEAVRLFGQNARHLYEKKYSIDRILTGFIDCIKKAHG